MKLRTLVVSVVVLAAISAVVFFLNRPAPPVSADSRIGQPLVDTATVEKAASLRVSDQGKTVTVVRQADGSWKVPSYYDLPVDFSKITGLIGSLTDAKIDRLVTTSADRIARLEFKDTKIELLDAAGKPFWTLTLGKTPESGGGRFLRYGDEQKAYLANLSAWIDPDAKNWANPEILALKPEEIAKVEIPLAEGGTYTVSRAKKEDPWKADNAPAGQQLKTDKVGALVSSLGNIRFSDTNDLTDASFAAAKEHARTYKLTTFAGKTVSITLGRKPEEKKIKPPTLTADGKTGPAALGTVADLNKKDDKPDEKKPLAPEFETIPAGPVFVVIANSDSAAPINTIMQKRAYQIPDYTYTALPQKLDDLFEAPAKPDDKKAEGKKPDEAPKP